MESSWRLNVLLLGCTTMETRFLAKLRTPAGFFTHIGTPHPAFPFLLRYFYDGSLIFQGNPWAGFVSSEAISGNFPYGRDVDPD